MNILFFGSTDDSVIILNALHALYPLPFTLSCIITQPPRPIGRAQIVTPTPVELWANAHNVPVVTFASSAIKSWEYEHEETVVDTLEPFKADIIISASYGQKIPTKTISDAKFGGLNVHPSILPRWRGADPVPWAILSGDKQIGVTIVTLSERFDEGKIIAQKKIPLLPSDTSDPVRTKLFSLGGAMITDLLRTFKGRTFKGSAQKTTNTPYARKFTRQDGYIPWDLIQIAMNTELGMMNTESWREIHNEYANEKIILEYLAHQPESDVHSHFSIVLERFFRALSPWPGLWTTIEFRDKSLEISEKRLKILSCHLNSNPKALNSALIIDSVQLEGKQPVSYAQFASAYL